MNISLSRILKDTSFTAFGALCSIMLGLVKNAMIATRYGTGFIYDAFLIAVNIPTLITGFALNGATNLVPIFAAELKNKTEEEAWDIGSRMLSFWILLILIFTIVFFFLVPVLTQILAPGFGEEQRALARHLSYIILWTSIFSGFTALANLVSYTYREFFTPALSGIMNNVVIISVLVVAAQPEIEILVIAVVLGAVAQLLIQYKALAKVKRFFRFRFDFRHPVIGRIVRLSIPQYIGQGGVALNTAIDRGFASMLPTGAISVISYSMMVVEIPISVFISAISRVYYPLFSHHADEPVRLREDVKISIKMITLIIFPVSVGLIALGGPIIRLLFERGAFTPEATALTATTVQFLALGLLGEGLNAVLTHVYFAKQDTVTPMAAGLMRVAVLVTLNFILVRPMGIYGLALSTSIATYVKLGALTYFYRRRTGLDPRDFLMGNFVKMGIASLTMGVSVYFMSQRLATYLPGPGLRDQVVLVGGCIGMGGVIYIGMLFLLRVREVSTAYSFVLKRINGWREAD